MLLRPLIVVRCESGESPLDAALRLCQRIEAAKDSRVRVDSSMQQIGEGAINIPATWINSTVNLFTAAPPGAPGPSVSVSRARLPAGDRFDEYTRKEMKKLCETLLSLTIVEERSLRVAGCPGYLVEFTWKGRDQRFMHQILLAVQVQENILNLVASHQGMMTSQLRQQMFECLQSFRPEGGPR